LVFVAGDDVIAAIPFAGHTPGSMLYVYDRVLFLGDSMSLSGGKLDFAPGAFNLDGGGCTSAADPHRLLADFIARANS
jgi:glyoxylase-like metal-dependent hydrolase (beta-lactamase superfamily II)